MIRLAFLLALCAAAPGLAAASDLTPAPGPARIIGAGDAGCIQGAVRLPDTAPGMQTIRVSRSAFWGYPTVIAALLDLALRAHAAGLPDLYMNDISRPRGGPFPGVHASHQRGLDADIWLDVAGPHPVLPVADRDDLQPPSLVRSDGRGVVDGLWRAEHATLIRLAATELGIDRVLVNPAIKRKLCLTVQGDRSWLRRVRPWYGHAAHMHLHFACPAGQPLCVDQAPLPAGDGCDASLQWWFDQLDKPAGANMSVPMGRPVVLPAACRAIMAAP